MVCDFNVFTNILSNIIDHNYLPLIYSQELPPREVSILQFS